MRCDHCQAQRAGVKRLTVQRFPPLLVLHIKRFRYSAYSREKLGTALDFPLTGLDLTHYAAPGYSCKWKAVAGGQDGGREGCKRGRLPDSPPSSVCLCVCQARPTACPRCTTCTP